MEQIGNLKRKFMNQPVNKKFIRELKFNTTEHKLGYPNKAKSESVESGIRACRGVAEIWNKQTLYYDHTGESGKACAKNRTSLICGHVESVETAKAMIKVLELYIEENKTGKFIPKELESSEVEKLVDHRLKQQ